MYRVWVSRGDRRSVGSEIGVNGILSSFFFFFGWNCWLVGWLVIVSISDPVVVRVVVRFPISYDGWIDEARWIGRG